MMISPGMYIESIKDKSYDDLLKERDSLMKKIRHFEKGADQKDLKYDFVIVSPSPEVKYQVNLLYLGKLCELISDVYKAKVWE